MKCFIKTVSLILALMLLLSLFGCGEDKKPAFVAEDEYYNIEDENGASGQSDAGNGDSNNTSQGESGNNSQNSGSDSGDDDFEPIEIIERDGFIPKEIPTRKNAYKLSNTMNKLQSGKTVNVVYYGGSVTGGTGSSDPEKKSWRALTTEFLKSQTSGTVNAVNSALGGTGSYLGAARFEQSVLAYDPDLLFIEFAINDKYSDLSVQQSKADIEYMIRKLNAKNPCADIVIVLVTNDSLYGSQYPTYNAHREVADHYGVPIVDFGCELYNKFKGSSESFKKLLSDSVHPNDEGYRAYADIMIAALKEMLVSAPDAPHNMPASKLCKNGFSTLKNHLASTISATGWSCKWWFDNRDYEKEGSQFRYSGDLKAIYPKYLAPDEIGNTITFKFTGNSFGILGTVKEGASLKIVLDGSTEKTVAGVSRSELLEYPVFENLENTSHTVTVTVIGNPPYVAIAAFVTPNP